MAKMLLSNPKVNVEEVPDPENPTLSILLFGYRAKFSTVRDKSTLLAQINRCKNGVKWSDLLDAYDGVEGDLQSLLRGGEVLGVLNSEEKDKIARMKAGKGALPKVPEATLELNDPYINIILKAMKNLQFQPSIKYLPIGVLHTKKLGKQLKNWILLLVCLFGRALII